MDGEKIGDDILEEISRKLDAIIDKLNLLERIFLEDPRYADLAEPFRLTRIFLNLYGEPLKILSRLRLAESYIRRESIQKDEIARCVIQVFSYERTDEYIGYHIRGESYEGESFEKNYP
jgi:hypothetical protein